LSKFVDNLTLEEMIMILRKSIDNLYFADFHVVKTIYCDWGSLYIILALILK